MAISPRAGALAKWLTRIRVCRELFLWFFSDDWGRHPSSCSICSAASFPRASHLVNTIGLRTPRLSVYDVRRAFQVIFSWLKPSPGSPKDTPGASGPAPRVLRPAMWLVPAGLVRRPQPMILSRACAARLDRHAPGKDAVLVSTLPIIPGLFQDARFRKKIYYLRRRLHTMARIDGAGMRRLDNGPCAAAI